MGNGFTQIGHQSRQLGDVPCCLQVIITHQISQSVNVPCLLLNILCLSLHFLIQLCHFLVKVNSLMIIVHCIYYKVNYHTTT